MPNISQHKGVTPDIAPVFAALGDDKRLMIVSKLLGEPAQSISQISQSFALTRQGVTRHIRVLEEAGLVRAEKRGREMRYSLETKELNRAKDYLARASRQWDAAINRLAQHLEG